MERPTVAKANRSAAKKFQKPAVDKAGLPKRKAKPKAAVPKTAVPKTGVPKTGVPKTPGRTPKATGKKKPGAVSKAAEALLRLVERSLDDDKAVDVAVLSLAGKTSIADYMVVASGRSQRQVGAMAEHLAQRIKKEGLGAAKVEGMPQNDWVLVDAGDVIVHLFRPEVRTFYNLEKMWAADFDAEAAAGT